MKLARSTYYYRPRRASGTTVEKRIARLCAEFPRYGYRRITAQLRSEGMEINHKAVSRVMRVLYSARETEIEMPYDLVQFSRVELSSRKGSLQAPK